MKEAINLRMNRRGRVNFPDGWLHAFFYTARSVGGLWLVIALVSILCYLPASTDPVLAGTSWVDAMWMGNLLLTLSWGGSLDFAENVGGGAWSLMPLGLTFLFIFALYSAINTAGRRSRGAGLIAAGNGLVWAWMITLFTPEATRVWAGLAGSTILVAGVTLAWAWRRGHVSLPGNLPVAVSAWEPGRAARASLRDFAIVAAGLGSVAIIAAGVAGRAQLQAIAGHLQWGFSTWLGLILLFVIYLPTWLVWALAWIAGPGFGVGLTSLYSPGEVMGSNLPPLPFWGFLPQGTPGWWVLAALILAGIGLGAWRVRGSHLTPSQTLAQAGVFAGLLLLGSLAAAYLTNGGVGPGSLAGSGPFVLSAVTLSVEVGAGYLAGALAFHPRALAWLRDFSTRVRGRAQAPAAPNPYSPPTPPTGEPSPADSL